MEEGGIDFCGLHIPSQKLGSLSLSIDSFNGVWTIPFVLKSFSCFCTQKTTARPEAPFFLRRAAQTKIRTGLILCQNDLQQRTRTWLQPYLLAFQHYDSRGISSRSGTMWAEEVYSWGINRQRRWIEDPTCKRSHLGENWHGITSELLRFCFSFPLFVSLSLSLFFSIPQLWKWGF